MYSTVKETIVYLGFLSYFYIFPAKCFLNLDFFLSVSFKNCFIEVKKWLDQQEGSCSEFKPRVKLQYIVRPYQ